MGFAGTSYSLQGFRDEQDRQVAKRRENMNALRELADQAAAQGKSLDLNTWFEMADSNIGPEGLLFGYAPSRQMLQQINTTANAKAEQVQKERLWESNRQRDAEDDRLQLKVEEMLRGNASNEDVVQNLNDLYGPDVAKRFTPKVASMRQRLDNTDYQAGMHIGGTMQTQQEADDYIERHGSALSQAQKDAIKRSARANEHKSNEFLWGIAADLGRNPALQGGDELVKTIKGRLQSLPHLSTPENVQRVYDMTMQQSASMANLGTYNVQQQGRTAWAQAAPTTAYHSAQFGAQVSQEEAKRAASVEDTIAKMREGRSAQVDAIIGKTDKLKGAALDGARQLAAHLQQYESRNPSALVEAMRAGPEALASAIEQDRKTAQPLRYLQQDYKEELRARNGVGYLGDPAADYRRVASIGAESSLPSIIRAGERANIARTQGQTRDAMALDTGAAKGIAQSVIQSREILGQSGRFAADPSQLAELERGQIMRLVQAYAGPNASQDRVMQLYVEVLKQTGEAPTIKGRPNIAEAFDQRTQQAGGQIGAQYPAFTPGYGAPAAPSAPAAPGGYSPAPFAGGYGSSQWWR